MTTAARSPDAATSAPPGNGANPGPSVTDINVPASDGFVLAATLFQPDTKPRAAVVIHSATGVPRKIYKGFAGYLAERGAAVLTYDYRGIGGSRPASLRGFAATMEQWALLDFVAAIETMRARFPALPVYCVGHSFGGQALGLAPNNGQIARALTVAAQAGYWRYFEGLESYRIITAMRLFRPLAYLYGYMPAWAGLGGELPRDVFLQWSRWIMTPGYFLGDETLAARENFKNYHGELRAIGLADDAWATPTSIERLCAAFTGTTPEIVQIRPAEIGATAIGHFGFFRPHFRDALWRPAADWLLR